MTQEHSTDLKQPIGIYILALLFMLAPLGNIIVSFAGSGVPNWYYPGEFVELIKTIPVMDWLWLGGIFVAGLALLARHKSAWLIAVFSLLIVLAMNTYRAFTIDETVLNPEFVRVQILISILVTFSVLIIAFYARYPYLDRRQQWMFPTAHRYDVKTPVVVHTGGELAGLTESISTAGIRIRLAKTSEALKGKTEVEFTFSELSDLKKVKAEVIEFSGDVLRLKYKSFGWGARGVLEAWLKSRKS
ncbi:PilZ domain-containing protein [Bdellovibrio sp. HCB337]|uniref:PilZ domain-containing protein n=1 Tax=Bdellovibrio sp. HCB337 TaxID=3394358 RepID=UPI0039A5B88E